ncbi:MAG: UDP-diphosphatase, partial [Thermotoga sp.]
MEAVILGIIQGLTEFLPISSSGHLVLVDNILKGNYANVPFIGFLHLGTFLAVLTFSIEAIGFSLKRPRVILNLIVSTVPAVIVGFSLKDELSNMERFLPLFFLVTTFFLILTKMKKGEKRMDGMSILDALIIGLAQALAIFPGVSRSGPTVSTAILLGFSKEDALKYSFLMSLPVILGAGVLSLSAVKVEYSIPAFITSVVFGIVSLVFLVRTVRRGKLWVFSYYTLF